MKRGFQTFKTVASPVLISSFPNVNIKLLRGIPPGLLPIDGMLVYQPQCGEL